jgi:hypothetical protein
MDQRANLTNEYPYKVNRGNPTYSISISIVNILITIYPNVAGLFIVIEKHSTYW